MTTKENAKPALPDIVFGTGEGLLESQYRGKNFPHCVIEGVKNSYDRKAKRIRVYTKEKRRFIIVDDGTGMRHENRCAFCAAGKPSGGGSSKFGQGQKHGMYSWMSDVTVKTVTDEVKDAVITFGFTTSEFQRKAFSEARETPKTLPLTKEHWPHGFVTGTEILYTFREPDRKGILRGKKLAEELAYRLPLYLHETILVDDESLPKRKIVGETFIFDDIVPGLGHVYIELFRPETQRNSQCVRMTGEDIGEAPVITLYQELGELRDRLPSIYLNKLVMGTISCEFLTDYATETRENINTKISEDERTFQLLLLLEKFAKEIGQKLHIKSGDSNDDASDESMNEIEDMLRDAFWKDPPEDLEGEPADKDKEKEPRKALLHLDMNRREFELGEEIRVTLKLHQDLQDKYPVADYEWNFDECGGKDITGTDTEKVLIASKLGEASIGIGIPGKSIRTKTGYAIVPKRRFRITQEEDIKIFRGTEITIRTTNNDKLKGEASWKSKGPGTLTPQGDSAGFIGTELGTTVVTVCDSKDSKVSSGVTIHVVKRPPKLIPIRDHWFTIPKLAIPDNLEYAMPAIMEFQGREAKVHYLMINKKAPGYAEAEAMGHLTPFLLQAIALAYGKFKVVQAAEPDDLEGRKYRDVMDEIQREGYSVYQDVAEVFTKNHSNKKKR